MKKHKLPENARGLLPIAFFFAAADIAVFLLQYGKTLNEMTQIGVFSRYLGELCLVIFIFAVISDHLKNGGKAEKKKRKRKTRSGKRKAGKARTVAEAADVRAENGIKAEAASAELPQGGENAGQNAKQSAVSCAAQAGDEPKQAEITADGSAAENINSARKINASDDVSTAEKVSTGEGAAAAAENVSTAEIAADEARQDATEASSEQTKKRRKLRTADKEKILKILYIIAFGQILVRMAVTAFRYSSDQLFQNSHSYTVAEAAVLGIVAAAAFFFKSRASSGEYRASTTYKGLFAACGTVYAAYAAVIAVSAVLKLNIYPYLAWVYRISLGYIALLLAFGLIVSIIKHDTAGEMNYPVFIPFINKTDGEKISDTLEKYTGLSLKSLWSIKLTGAVLPGAVLFLAVLLFVSTCVYKVEPYEEAVVYRFGTLSEMSVTQGLHFKLPYPIDKVELYEVHRSKSVTVGYEATGADDNLWNGTHASEEYTLLTGNGNELVSANLKLNYHISNLTDYIKTSSEPERILTAFAYEAVLSHTAFTDLDTLMSVDRTGLSAELKKEINEQLSAAAVGVTVDEVILESIHPPVDIADVYQSVVSAAVKKTTLITNAEKEAANSIANAEKTAKTSVKDAEARQTEKISTARYDAAVFDAADEAYRQHPESFRLSKYLDTFVTAVKGKKMYVFTPSAESSMNDYILNRAGGNVTVVE